ncbi:MAG: hypothetical protein M1840_002667 [Geoglossum simile]|nr:MAG: hypothetical protein M1840_002667 [Geoglossum simile]
MAADNNSKEPNLVAAQSSVYGGRIWIHNGIFSQLLPYLTDYSMNVGISTEVVHSNISLSTPKKSRPLTDHSMDPKTDRPKEPTECNMNINPRAGVECSSVDPSTPDKPSEDFSMESLLQRVDEFQKREQLETLRRLTMENSLLQKHIACYQESWCATLDLLQEACEAVLLMQHAFQRCSGEGTAAERDWLAFWGIPSESDKTSKYRLAGWI